MTLWLLMVGYSRQLEQKCLLTSDLSGDNRHKLELLDTMYRLRFCCLLPPSSRVNEPWCCLLFNNNIPQAERRWSILNPAPEMLSVSGDVIQIFSHTLPCVNHNCWSPSVTIICPIRYDRQQPNTSGTLAIQLLSLTRWLFFISVIRHWSSDTAYRPLTPPKPSTLSAALTWRSVCKF